MSATTARALTLTLRTASTDHVEAIAARSAPRPGRRPPPASACQSSSITAGPTTSADAARASSPQPRSPPSTVTWSGSSRSATTRSSSCTSPGRRGADSTATRESLRASVRESVSGAYRPSTMSPALAAKVGVARTVPSAWPVRSSRESLMSRQASAVPEELVFSVEGPAASPAEMLTLAEAGREERPGPAGVGGRQPGDPRNSRADRGVRARRAAPANHGRVVAAAIEVHRVDVGEEPAGGMTSIVGTSMRTSLRLAPSIGQPIGTPWRSDATAHFQPNFPRSVGFRAGPLTTVGSLV